MVNRLVKGITVFLLLVSIAAIFTQSRAFAQDAQSEPGVFRSEKLEMIVRAGFGRLELRGWEGSWVPFRILLVNHGEAISGRLVVVCKNQNWYGRDFVKDVQLPTGSRQLHEITAYLDSNEDVEVRLEANGNPVANTNLDVERQGGYNSRIVIAVVDSDSTALNNLANLEMPLNHPRQPFSKVTAENTPQTAQDADASQTGQQNSNASPQNRRRGRGGPWGGYQDPAAFPVVIAPEDLPRDFIAYNPVDVVVLGDAPLSQLTEDQARALKYWVASGGLLIVTGGADISGLRATGLESILPVEVQGTTTVPALAELTDVYGQFENKDALLILSAQGRPNATTLLGNAGNALVAESHYGNGVVRFVAYNPKLNPYRGWTAAKYLWTDLLKPAAETRSNTYMWGRSRNGTDVQNSLYKMAEIKPTSSTYFLFFLALYVLAVGPANYLILRWKKKLDLAWVTIPAVVLLFTVISIVFAQLNKEGAVAADSSVVELYQPEGIQQMRGGFLIRSNSTGWQNVTLDGREFYAINSNQGGPPPSNESLELEREQGRLQLKIPTTNGAASFFLTRAVSETKSPIVAAQESGATAVRVKNLSDTTIGNAVYISSLGVSDAFTLEPGEEKQVSLSVPQTVRFNEWYLSQLPAESDEYATFDGLAYSLARGTARTNPRIQGFFGDDYIHNTYKAISRPMVMGFVDRTSEKIAIEGMAKRRSKTFYVVHL